MREETQKNIDELQKNLEKYTKSLKLALGKLHNYTDEQVKKFGDKLEAQENAFKASIEDFNRRNAAIVESLKALDAKLSADFKRIDERIDEAFKTRDNMGMTIRSKMLGDSFYKQRQSEPDNKLKINLSRS